MLVRRTIRLREKLMSSNTYRDVAASLIFALATVKDSVVGEIACHSRPQGEAEVCLGGIWRVFGSRPNSSQSLRCT